jgi:hypothetical protein
MTTMANETRKFQVAEFTKTSKVHPEQEYKLRLFVRAIAEPPYKGQEYYGTEAQMRDKMKEIGIPDSQIQRYVVEA